MESWCVDKGHLLTCQSTVVLHLQEAFIETHRKVQICFDDTHPTWIFSPGYNSKTCMVLFIYFFLKAIPIFLFLLYCTDRHPIIARLFISLFCPVWGKLNVTPPTSCPNFNWHLIFCTRHVSERSSMSFWCVRGGRQVSLSLILMTSWWVFETSWYL